MIGQLELQLLQGNHCQGFQLKPVAGENRRVYEERSPATFKAAKKNHSKK
jgi:hypothetical protein